MSGFRDIHYPWMLLGLKWRQDLAAFRSHRYLVFQLKGLATGNRRFTGTLKTQAGGLIEFWFGMLRKRQAELDTGGT